MGGDVKGSESVWSAELLSAPRARAVTPPVLLEIETASAGRAEDSPATACCLIAPARRRQAKPRNR
jgi:hypothetical protein